VVSLDHFGPFVDLRLHKGGELRPAHHHWRMARFLTGTDGFTTSTKSSSIKGAIGMRSRRAFR
jgi:hypothetical protein